MTENTDLYLTTMANGDVWSVPVMVIARNRAENYKDEYDDDIERSLAEDTWPLFTHTPAEIYDWAQNNMDWSDVADKAFIYRQATKPAEDWEESWCNGKHDVVKAND